MDELALLALPAKERFLELRKLYNAGKTEIVAAVGKELAKRRKEAQGDWQEACRILDATSEPTVTSSGEGKAYINVTMPKIQGYGCEYVRYLTKNGKKSWLVIFNHTNDAHRKNYSVVTTKEAKGIFA